MMERNSVLCGRKPLNRTRQPHLERFERVASNLLAKWALVVEEPPNYGLLRQFYSASTRKGQSLPISSQADGYSPGDLVTWDLGGNVPHIGTVVDRRGPQTGRYMLVHNIGQGPKMEDVLFNWRITGHYRYFGPNS